MPGRPVPLCACGNGEEANATSAKRPARHRLGSSFGTGSAHVSNGKLATTQSSQPLPDVDADGTLSIAAFLNPQQFQVRCQVSRQLKA